MDGKFKSARFLSMANETKVIVEECYIKNFLSFCTIIEPLAVLKLDIKIFSCYFEDLQDGIKILVNPTSIANIAIDRLKLELDFLEPDNPASNGIFVKSGGDISLKNIVMEATHADFEGIFLENSNEVFAKNIFIGGNAELVEETSIGKGLNLKNVETAYIRNCKFQNLRIGMELVCDSDYSKSIKMLDITTQKCSIGSLIHGASQNVCKIALANYQSTVCYYGLMIDITNNQIFLSSLNFENVPKPIIVKKNIVKSLNFITSSKFSYPLIPEINIENIEDSEIEEAVRQPIYIQFCSKEKIPYRVAYEHDDFTILWRQTDHPMTTQNIN